MGLFEKLIGADTKVPVHQFAASLRLWQSGTVTRADIIAEYRLDAADEADLDWLKGKYVASAAGETFVSALEAMLLLGESGLHGLDVKANFVAAVNSLG